MTILAYKDIKVKVWLTTWFVLCNSFCQAQRLGGTWNVVSYVTKTTSLDGKKTFKGPFTFRPQKMSVTIGGKKYVERIEDKIITYSMSKNGQTYKLRRSLDGKNIAEIVLSDLSIKGDTLSFVSRRSNLARKERTVVQWKLERANTFKLEGIEWRLVEIAYNNDEVLKPSGSEQMTILVSNGKISGIAGVNRYSGSAKISKNREVEFGPLVSTRAADPEGSIAPQFLRDLGQVKSFMILDQVLILELPVDVGVLRFKAGKVIDSAQKSNGTGK